MSGIAQSLGMVGLDAETRKMVIETIRDYARERLSLRSTRE